jgi:hypothetical protein
MNYANCSNSPNSISSIVYTSGNINISGGNFFAPINKKPFSNSSRSHSPFFSIFLCLTLTGKYFNDHDDADDMI